MLVYRITKATYADRLTASGGAARWNTRGMFVIYTAPTRALACLENVVHRSGEGLAADFRMMVIEVPDTLLVIDIPIKSLPDDWFDFRQYAGCHRIGGEWLESGRSAVLRVPSAIISNECNYLLNPAHPNFRQISLLRAEPFLFDPRIRL